MSLYDELGQTTGIRSAVEVFYAKVLGDSELRHYFEGVDMARLRRHQAALLVQVTGGPASYDGRELAQAHQPLNITDAAFDRVVDHLAATLTELGAGAEPTGAVTAALQLHRADIVGAGSPAAR